MNVYAIEAYGTYGGGMAVIAAESVADAVALASTIKSDPWHVRYATPEDVTLLDGISAEGGQRIIAHYETGE